MYLDPNDHNTHSIIDQIKMAVDSLPQLTLIEKLKPTFSKDGNKYCYLYGELPNDCVLGFGDTAEKAMNDFYHNFYNNKA